MGADTDNNDIRHNPASILAGTILNLIPVPDGPDRERLLDVANPYRGALHRIVKRSDPEDERVGMRRHFKTVNTQYLHPSVARDLIDSCLDGDDRSTFTASHDHTRDALEALRDELNDYDPDEDGPDNGDEDDPTPVDDIDPDEYAAFQAWKANQATTNTEDQP